MITGKTITISELFEESTVNDLKKKIQCITGDRSIHQILIFKGKSLIDDALLSEYNISGDDIIYMILKLKGGGSSFKFSDMKHLNTAEYATVYNPSKYPIVSKGLNLEVNCNCAGFRSFIRKGFGEFEIGSEINVKCPKCENDTFTIACGFSHCFYSWKGMTKDGFRNEGNGCATNVFVITNSSDKCYWKNITVKVTPLKRKVFLTN